MTATGIGVGGIVTLFVLVAVHVPLAFAMIVVGIVAFALQTELSWLLGVWPGFIKGGGYTIILCINKSW